LEENRESYFIGKDQFFVDWKTIVEEEEEEEGNGGF
jgi:hypothetical protein